MILELVKWQANKIDCFKRDANFGAMNEYFL